MYMNFIVLCGGNGSRLFPLSRNKLPKQFLALTNSHTMLQNTLIRIKGLISKINNSNNKIIIICNSEHSFIVEKQVEELNLNEKVQIVAEPIGRDSGPAICIGSLLGNSDEYSFVFPCDHIFDDVVFNNTCHKALEYIESNIVTFGINPNRVETGFGYIKTHNKQTVKFVEKPTYNLAKEYVDSGLYLWNGGIFAFKNSNMIRCFQNYKPHVLEHCRLTLDNTDFSAEVIKLNSKYFSTCESISVDYAIMEPLSDINNSNLFKIGAITLKYDGYWNDIGSFSALHDELLLKNPDIDGNIVSTDTFKLNSTNTFVNSNKFTAIIGLNDIMIIDTDDALVVANKKNSQDVKKVVDYLKVNKRVEATEHRLVYRPWGYYKSIEGNDYSGFKVKRITVYPNQRLSLQSHTKRAEHWVIVNGIGKMQLNDEYIIMKANDHIYIPIGAFHRIENIGDELLEFTETQIGKYLGEDDIIRYSDDYGRV